MRKRAAKRSKRHKSKPHRNITGKKTRGGFGKASCPYVGKPWNSQGPSSNLNIKGPVVPHNDSNFYERSKYGIVPGGIDVFFGDKSVRNYKGGRKTARRRKKTKKNKSLGVKKGGFKLTDFVPNVILNLSRPIQTALYNKAPLIGRQWRGLTKKVSPLPTVQPKLQGSTKIMANQPSKIKPINIKAIRESAKNYVKNLQ